MKTRVALLATVLVTVLLSGCSFEVRVNVEDDLVGGPIYAVAQAKTSGGMCPDGECASEVKIMSDGRVIVDYNTDQEVGSISSVEVQDLKGAIAEIEVDSLPERGEDYTCPVAFDGQKTEFTFYGEENTPVTIDSCEYDPYGLEAVQMVERIWEDTVAHR